MFLMISSQPVGTCLRQDHVHLADRNPGHQHLGGGGGLCSARLSGVSRRQGLLGPFTDPRETGCPSLFCQSARYF